ncbi:MULTISPECIES: helix-turn-helix domain-containing protein [Ensifer]|jgi:DNA-binding HxlR family transcriptional regulator|uniref:Transcriptional regulator n=1 Tax=Ensifer canadensis TaxID=555315 RepID=A0AAW4FD82_9HYPH|nr:MULTISPECIES: helix-turn-helix domain-containing protein [Ensifer]AHK43234.1 putative transcriptional regulator protein [Ensifer adhaerens OV14]MDP9628611.1 DNA-binding HxlR family transcriptional regulator [Ensifer adhaerens]KQU98270.1 PadR family transcriptional regulator [Ensifer sp. Root31]KQW63029.1 PadR family transcriptional regulator [Ensifer sp. Root1252]KQW85044.1 PadR family transcriptional regulator [Ensifer sp. Root127]
MKISTDPLEAPITSIPDVFDPTCSSRHALELIASKWAMLIISALEEGPMRNAALMRRLGDVSQKMLTQTLKELERNGLVIREDKKTVPPHVEYSLSAVGRSLSETLLVLDRWAETHFGTLDAARARYDAERGK